MQRLLVKEEGPVTRLALNQPERRNPLGLEMMEELVEALTNLSAESRVVVISGEGPAFSAGHDLKELVGAEQDFLERVFAKCTLMMESVQAVPQPVIARVHGVATAAGCQLVAACDLAVAGQSAQFATPGVNIGLFCSTPMVPLTRAVGRKRAMQMLLTGELIDAETAADWGLVNQVVPDDRLDDAVDHLVDAILRSSKTVVGLGKRTFYEQIDLDQHRAYEHTKQVMVSNARLDDAQEGMSAFLEKRKPEWRSS
ncbi:MAG TPA: enoyl-CoA hydratase [Acidimicrobiia bacterium]|jgi:enoyl-CoA hydratase/carnithine racemase